MVVQYAYIERSTQSHAYKQVLIVLETRENFHICVHLSHNFPVCSLCLSYRRPYCPYWRIYTRCFFLCLKMFNQKQKMFEQINGRNSYLIMWSAPGFLGFVWYFCCCWCTIYSLIKMDLFKIEHLQMNSCYYFSV